MSFTKSEVIEYVKSLVGGGVDYDGAFGMQCVDLPAHLMQKFCNFTPWGNAIDYMSNALPPGAQRFSKGDTDIQPGDIAIWLWGDWDVFGHIGFVTAVDGRSITSVEQNVDGAPVGVGGPARIQTRLDDCLVGFIRLPYSSDPETDANVEKHNYTRVPETGTFTSTIDEHIYIRMGEPSTSAPYAKDENGDTVWYDKGMSVDYDSYVINEGYVWISYVGESGNRNYIATGPHNGQARSSKPWGVFK